MKIDAARQLKGKSLQRGYLERFPSVPDIVQTAVLLKGSTEPLLTCTVCVRTSAVH